MWFKNLILSIITPASVSHDPSEIILIFWFADLYQFFWWIEYIINVFIITFDQFKASMLDKIINLFNPQYINIYIYILLLLI